MTFNMIQRSCFLLALWLLFFGNCWGQNTISGKVLDGVNQEPLPHAHVHFNGEATLTDIQGEFTLEADNLPVHLIISHVGYLTDSIQIDNSKTELVIALSVASTDLHEVVVSASHRNEPIKNTPASVGMITRVNMKRDDKMMITPSLNRIPGVYMQSGTMSTNRISIRGIGARIPYGTNKIRAYYDHIPLTNGVGETTIEDIDMGMIERVEVIKGPNSSIYGAGLGGVINIKPRLADFNNTSLASSATVGSYNTSRFVNTFSHSSEGNNINIIHSLINSDGYRENNEYYRHSIGFTGRFSTSETSHLSIIGNYIYLKSFIPSAIDEDTYQNDPQSAAFTWNAAQGFEAYDKAMLGLSYQQKMASHWFSNTALFINFRDAYEPRPFDILRENSLGTGIRQSIRFQYENFSINSGFELFRDFYSWDTYDNLYENDGRGSILGGQLSDNKEVRGYYNIFMQANLELNESWSFVGGVNYNRSQYRYLDFFLADTMDSDSKHTFDPVTSPRFGVVFHQRENIHYYVNVSHGFSPPSLEESRNLDGTLNTSVQPEKGWNFETGGRGSLLENNLDYDISVYYMIIHDLLVAQRDSVDAYVGANAGETSHLGVEFSLGYDHDLNTRYTLHYYVNGTVMHYRFSDFVQDSSDHSGNKLTGVPSEIVHAGIDLRSATGFYGSLNGEYTGQIPLNDANSLFSDWYLVFRSKLGYTFRLGQFEFDLFAGIKNLTDTHYASMVQINAQGFGDSDPRYYYPGEPRNYFGGLSVKYEF